MLCYVMSMTQFYFNVLSKAKVSSQQSLQGVTFNHNFNYVAIINVGV